MQQTDFPQTSFVVVELAFLAAQGASVGMLMASVNSRSVATPGRSDRKITA